MLSNINSLMTVYEQCRTGEPLPRDVQKWLASSLERYLHRKCDSLNEAFGLVHAHGGIPWWREAAIRVRDANLREMAERHFAELSVNGRASAIARLSKRYEGTSWPRDRDAATMPIRYRGTFKQYLWQAFRSGAKMPLSERRLRSLLVE